MSSFYIKHIYPIRKNQSTSRPTVYQMTEQLFFHSICIESTRAEPVIKQPLFASVVFHKLMLTK